MYVYITPLMPRLIRQVDNGGESEYAREKVPIHQTLHANTVHIKKWEEFRARVQTLITAAAVAAVTVERPIRRLAYAYALLIANKFIESVCMGHSVDKMRTVSCTLHNMHIYIF